MTATLMDGRATAAKLTSFAVALVAVFGAAFGVGRAVGPLDAHRVGAEHEHVGDERVAQHREQLRQAEHLAEHELDEGALVGSSIIFRMANRTDEVLLVGSILDLLIEHPPAAPKLDHDDLVALRASLPSEITRISLYWNTSVICSL